MSEIHILAADGRQIAYSEEQVAAMRARGQLSPETYFWKEGMPEWRPLRDLSDSEPPPATNRNGLAIPPRRSASGPTVIPVSTNTVVPPRRSVDPVADASAPTRPEWKINYDVDVEEVPARYFLRCELQPLATVLLIFLGLCFVAGLLCLYADVYQYLLLERDNYTHEEAQFNNLQYQVFSLSRLALFFLTTIPFALWVYRAYKNCRSYVTDMKYSAGWAVGSFFVPIACLFYPCLALQEIWKVSSNPKRRRNQHTSTLVSLWWGLWLLSNLTYGLSWWFARTAHERFDYINLTEINAAHHVNFELVCTLAFCLVLIITRKQQRLAG